MHIMFFCIPQTILHFLGIGHDRARGPAGKHTRVSEMPEGLNKNTRTFTAHQLRILYECTIKTMSL